MRKNIILFSIISAGILLFIVFTLYLFTDEISYYLPAAREIVNGRALYKDFFFPQMPLSAMVFIPFSGGGWSNLFLARLSSSLLAIISGVALLLYTFHITKSREDVIYMGILWAGNALLLYSSAQATPKVWVNFLNILFLVLFFFSLIRKNPVCSILAGLCIGLSASFRSIFFILFVIVGILLLSKREWRILFYITIGSIIGAIPSIYYLVVSTDQFLFCNIFYHFNRIEPTIYWQITRRLRVLFMVFLFPVNIVLFILIAKTWRRKETGTVELFALFCAGVLFIFYYLFITPTHFGYMTEIYPFLLFSLAPQMGFLKKRRWLLLLYISSYIPCSLMYSVTIRDWQKGYTISNVRKVVKTIEDATEKDDKVVSFGFQFGFLARRQTLPEFAIPTYDIAKAVTGNVRKRYHLTAYEDIPELLYRYRPSLLVDVFEEKDRRFFRLDELGYEKIKEHKRISIFGLAH